MVVVESVERVLSLEQEIVTLELLNAAPVATIPLIVRLLTSPPELEEAELESPLPPPQALRASAVARARAW